MTSLENASEGLGDLQSIRMHAFKDVGDRQGPSETKLFVTESMAMDYFTLSGIENKLGLKPEDIPTYILQELLANGIDYVETSENTNPEITVEITTEAKVINLKVSNPDRRQSFTDEIIHDIFDFDNYSSTKRRQFKITRGALGHGLKTVLSTSYTLATEHYGYPNWTPIKVTNGKDQWTVSAMIDRITGKVYSPNIENSSIIDSVEKTIIEVDIPVSEDRVDKIVVQFKDVFYKFLILNPHITMNIIVDDNHKSYHQVQGIKSDWNNLHTINSYSDKDFETLIFNIKGENLTLNDIVESYKFREGRFIQKKEFDIPLIKSKYDKTIIQRLCDALRKGLSAIPELDLPYDMRIKYRRDAIKKRLEQLGIHVKNIKYQLISGRYKSDNPQIKSPFIFDIAEIETENSKRSIISGINSSPTQLEHIYVHNGFGCLKINYNWTYDTIDELLHKECGYSNNPKEDNKPNYIVFMNLVSPRIDYESYAKSQFNLTPFSGVIGQADYETCKGVKRGQRGKLSQTNLLTTMLTKRYYAVMQNPNLIISDRWTPSDLWYGCRVYFKENGIKVGKNTRSNFTAKIRPLCEKLFNCNMEELGIFAADRAQLYFNGHWNDVGFDDLHSLKLIGTDMIIVEKEGMAEVLIPRKRRYGSTFTEFYLL